MEDEAGDENIVRFVRLPALLTPEQAANFLGCRLTAIYDLMKKGELSYIQYLRRRRIRSSDLQDFIERHTIAPRAALTRRYRPKAS